MRSGTICARGASALLLGWALCGPVSAQYQRQPNAPDADFGVTHVIKWLQYANAFCGAANGKLPGAIVTWSGACRDGWLEGPGTLQIGLPFGVNGIAFTGTFAHGLAEGPAHVSFADGPVTSFAGTFHDDLPNGPGVVTERGGRRIAGDYVYDAPTGKIAVDYVDGAHAEFVMGGQDEPSTLRFADGTTQHFGKVTTVNAGDFTRVIYPDGSHLTANLRYIDQGDAVYCGADGTRYAGAIAWARPDRDQSLALAYPDLSRRLNEQGLVEVALRIGRDGSKTAIALHISSGIERLDNAALAAVTSWHYLPATVDGHPIPMTLVVGVTFDLHPPRYDEGDAPISVAAETPETRRAFEQQRRWIRKSCAALR